MFDLIVTVFCALTLLVLAFAGCGAGSKEEEMLDTLLLIARNILQFGRLASVMRQYVSALLSSPSILDFYLFTGPAEAYSRDLDPSTLRPIQLGTIVLTWTWKQNTTTTMRGDLLDGTPSCLMRMTCSLRVHLG